MSITLEGIHHVTAIASDPQKNVDFYAGALGLRLVKRTVNFDDPTTYHLYYGDEKGAPGSLMTFFPWPRAPRGRAGTGQINATAFSIPPASLGYWLERMVRHGIPHEGPAKRFDAQVLTVRDPDGLVIELVATSDERAPWEDGPVPAAHAIRGLHSTTIWRDAETATGAMLIDLLGFREAGREGAVTRYATGTGGPGALLDVRDATGFWRGTIGVGTVHHMAWRMPDTDVEDAARNELARRGVPATDIIDRQYFKSVYFHEPGGVLLELATDGPGFARDEPLATLGTKLMLPPWFERDRAMLEATLPPIHPPALLETAIP